jgi:hypothetical protein
MHRNIIRSIIRYIIIPRIIARCIIIRCITHQHTDRNITKNKKPEACASGFLFGKGEAFAD